MSISTIANPHYDSFVEPQVLHNMTPLQAIGDKIFLAVVIPSRVCCVRSEIPVPKSLSHNVAGVGPRVQFEILKLEYCTHLGHLDT